MICVLEVALALLLFGGMKKMPHMVPDYRKGDWIEIDGSSGVFFWPKEHFTTWEARDSYPGEIYTQGIRYGVGVRLSAPGYLDSTDWAVFDTEEEARSYIEETYDVDPETGESLEHV